MAFGKEIKRIREASGLTASKLVKLIGINSLQRYKGWEQGDYDPKFDDRILIEKFFKISIDKIVKLDRIPDHLLTENDNKEELESKKTFHEKLKDKKLEPKEIPVMGGFTNLSIIEIHNDDFYDKHKIVGTLSQDLFPGCDHAEKAKGDSMYPLIMNNALLVGKRCSSEGIVFGEKYIIKTKSGIDTTKFVHPKKEDGKIVKGYIVLIAHNKHIPEQDISIDDIVFACRVHWIINPT